MPDWLNENESAGMLNQYPTVAKDEPPAPVKDLVPWYHFLHTWTKWEHHGKITLRQHLNPDTGELLQNPVITGTLHVQIRHCVVCNAEDFRGTRT